MSFLAGWRDYVQGRPWPDMSRWPDKRQLSYEEGRHAAAALKGAGVDVTQKPNVQDLPGRLLVLVNDEIHLTKQPAAECYRKPSSWRTLPSYRRVL